MVIIIYTYMYSDKLLLRFSPAHVCPPFLDVTCIIDCAVNGHVIVVPGNVEWTGKFYGALVKKIITQLVVCGFII